MDIRSYEKSVRALLRFLVFTLALPASRADTGLITTVVSNLNGPT